MSNPESIYLRVKDDSQAVLALPLEGKRRQFRDFLVGYLMVEHGYSEVETVRVVTGKEAAILVMLAEEDECGLV